MDDLKDVILYEIRENRKAIQKIDKRVSKTETKVYTFSVIIGLIMSQMKYIVGVFK